MYKPFICHRKSKYGDMLLVHFDGYLESNGTLFHSRYDEHSVILEILKNLAEVKRFDMAVMFMSVAEKTALSYSLRQWFAPYKKRCNVFESRKEGNGQPIWFTLGIREVIKGWDKGMQNMCAGEKRKLTVPSSLAYGKDGKGKIPPNSTLIFDMEILEIRNGPRSHESFQEMDLNDDWKLSRQEVKEYLRKEFERHGYAPNDTHHENMVEDIFKKEDEDSDGFISSREFTYKHDEL
ncbi:UNVERIFIED_CONTAM: hypothetical protein FKN15_024031 [Acipenser sinensis]